MSELVSFWYSSQNEKHKDSVQLCQAHYLEHDIEGFDTFELKIHDRNTNIWLSSVSKPSLQKYNSIKDFLKAFKKLKSYDFGNVVITSEGLSEIEFKFIKLSNISKC